MRDASEILLCKLGEERAANEEINRRDFQRLDTEDRQGKIA